MAATIKIKNSSTANAKPTSSDLVQGELAINVTDKKIFTEDSGGNVVELGANFNGFKNRIINGAMMIDQRNAGASVSIGDNYTVDRWSSVRAGGAATMTAQRSTTAPVGFTNSLLFTVGTGATPSGTDQTFTDQKIEGFNVADLGWGTANAQTVTISFWIRSSVTGLYGLTVRNSSNNRAYVASYTVNSANTFEFKTVTITGDTSGTWSTDNSTGIRVIWDLGSGSTYSQAAGSWTSGSFISGLTGGTKLSATSGATFYITGVQLEKGSTATSFDYRPYGTELALCQRYCVVWGTALTHLGTGSAYNSTAMNITVPVPVPMRATPTPSKTTTGGNWLNVYVGASAQNSNSTPEVGEAGVSAYRIYTPSAGTGWTAGQASWCQVLSGASFTLSAEL